MVHFIFIQVPYIHYSPVKIAAFLCETPWLWVSVLKNTTKSQSFNIIRLIF